MSTKITARFFWLRHLNNAIETKYIGGIYRIYRKTLSEI